MRRRQRSGRGQRKRRQRSGHGQRREGSAAAIGGEGEERRGRSCGVAGARRGGGAGAEPSRGSGGSKSNAVGLVNIAGAHPCRRRESRGTIIFSKKSWGGVSLRNKKTKMEQKRMK